MEQRKEHQVSIKLTTEEYGWLVRYCDSHDVSMASVIRKGFRMYRTLLEKKKAEKAKKE